MNKKERYMWSLKRRGKDITQQEMADYLGYSKSMINRFEKGDRNIKEGKLELYKEYIENKVIEWEE